VCGDRFRVVLARLLACLVDEREHGDEAAQDDVLVHERQGGAAAQGAVAGADDELATDREVVEEGERPLCAHVKMEGGGIRKVEGGVYV
jgi:hypothetical protein